LAPDGRRLRPHRGQTRIDRICRIVSILCIPVGGRRGTSSPRRLVGSVFAFSSALALLCPPGEGAARRSRRLVTASFGHKTDTQGFNWDIDQRGRIDDGTNDCFDGAENLSVNGVDFLSNRPQMTADGSEYVLTSTNVPGIEVTRRVKVDLRSGAVRYVESFKGKRASTASVTATLTTQLGGNCQVVVTDSGSHQSSALGKKDGGFVAVQHPGMHRPSVLFFLASPGAKIKPSVSVQSNRTFRFAYTLTVPPGQTVSVLHGIAQRRLAGTPDPKTLASMFKKFNSRAWTRDLPAEVRRTIVNTHGLGLGGALGQALAALERLGVERGSRDVLALGDESRLTGTATCARLSVTTRYGSKTVPFEKVAGLSGARFRSGRPQVFLRDGQVLTGPVETKGLRFTLSSGLTIELRTETLDRLLTRRALRDGEPGQGVRGWIETVEGDRLAVSGSGPSGFKLATPWGTREVSLGNVLWLKATDSAPLGHRVALNDGSRFGALLEGPGVELDTVLFGPQTFEPSKVLSIAAKRDGATIEDLESGEILEPHVTLVGESVIVGRVDLAELRFVSFGEVVPVPPEQIRAMEAAPDQDDVAPRAGPFFSAEIWAGGAVAGRLMDVVLPVRTGEGAVLNVPAGDVVRVSVPSPTVPAGLRDKIAGFLRDLGHPDWETREAASKELEELGYLAKGQLEEALKTTTDPEVRRRVQNLIDGLGR
jgi:hypothetical protein